MSDIKQPKKRSEWFKLVDEQAESGLSQKEFCKLHNLVLCRFGYYKKLRAGETRSVPQGSFVPVALKQSGLPDSGVKIELPNGFCCHVPAGITPEKLKQIIGALISC